MKRIAIFSVFLAALMMSGCLVSSIHPFYFNKDKVYDPSLVGSWIDSDSCIWIIEKNMTPEGLFSDKERSDSTYFIRYYEKSDACSYLQGTLFELNEERYVDFFPEPDADHFDTDMTQFHYVPVHTLARIRFDRDTMMLFWFGEEWLNKLFENNRIRIDHEKVTFSSAYQSNVLTAETEDLQKFILKYMNDETTAAQVENAFSQGEEPEEHAFVKLYPYEGSLPSN